ncbi:glycosyltransferase family 1 protein [Haloterrigena sp. H1]|uniref:glycosyltransferase family 4 protein n=1 Tax=Haloterrigena sp. H1 TaxID=2552943 RepID=UPI00110E6082|nr:glycosyltransferase family 4 protein [Haloterrigena sp. H1]TMT87010.1 glycosyltransferase family 1 protein [Haloterrigena sp. H1]
MEKPISILLINPADKIRAEVKNLMSTLPEMGFEVSVFLSQKAKKDLSTSSSAKIITFNGTYIPRIRYSLPTSSFLRSLSDVIRDHDIVHICSHIYLTSFAASIVGKFHDKPIIVTVDTFPGLSWSYGNAFIDSIGKLYNNTFGKIILRNATQVVGLGKYLQEDLDKISTLDKVTYIHNGIDIDKYSPKHKRSVMENPESISLLFVGRLDSIKNVGELIKSLNHLRDSGRNYQLTIVGDGSLRTELEELAKTTGVSEVVEFVGWQQNVVQYYREADIFVLPSLSEGQPTVLMEAHACGLPVVTTNVGGAKELVTVGSVVSTPDENALAEAVEQLVNRDLVGYSKQAREVAVEEYSSEAMAKGYAELYSDVA